MKFRFLSSGESHGKALNAIIDGVPANFDISIEAINAELARRQEGYGRGGRMKIEKDTVLINSGIRFGKTTGAPIALEVKNKDFANWEKAMSTETLTEEELANTDIKSITKLRPGHADFAGSIKYNQNDVRNILERSSARETAVRVAVGAVAKQILEKFDVKISSKVIAIGSIEAQDIDADAINDLNCPDKKAYELMKAEIDKAAENGVTLGGKIKIRIENLPVGIGSHVQWDRKLDGILAQALMSIQAVKAVEIGLGCDCAVFSGDKVHDEIFYENNSIIRKTNNAGGIEGGMTNGEPIEITISMKPIPTMRAPLQSIDLIDKSAQAAHFERSDTCAVPACGVVAEAMSAIVITQQFLEKFGGDSFEEILANFQNYKRMIAQR